MVKELLGNIKGPKGDTGPKGDKGEKGDTGTPGSDGAKGDTGAPGSDGLTPVLTLEANGDLYVDYE